MSKKLPILDKKISVPFSITRKVIIAFEERCSTLGVCKSNIAEELIITFLKDTK